MTWWKMKNGEWKMNEWRNIKNTEGTMINKIEERNRKGSKKGGNKNGWIKLGKEWLKTQQTLKQINKGSNSQ